MLARGGICLTTIYDTSKLTSKLLPSQNVSSDVTFQEPTQNRKEQLSSLPRRCYLFKSELIVQMHQSLFGLSEPINLFLTASENLSSSSWKIFFKNESTSSSSQLRLYNETWRESFYKMRTNILSLFYLSFVIFLTLCSSLQIQFNCLLAFGLGVWQKNNYKNTYTIPVMNVWCSPMTNMSLSHCRSWTVTYSHGSV